MRNTSRDPPPAGGLQGVDKCACARALEEASALMPIPLGPEGRDYACFRSAIHDTNPISCCRYPGTCVHASRLDNDAADPLDTSSGCQLQTSRFKQEPRRADQKGTPILKVNRKCLEGPCVPIIGATVYAVDATIGEGC